MVLTRLYGDNVLEAAMLEVGGYIRVCFHVFLFPPTSQRLGFQTPQKVLEKVMLEVGGYIRVCFHVFLYPPTSKG